ncbi:MAG: T9SS type A sorting domain-containing protein, partial [Candidatus Zixiibacteriota bacterium]
VLIRSPFEVTDVSEVDPAAPSLAVDENDYVTAAWVDVRDGSTAAYYQVFNNGLSPVSSNRRVSTVMPEFMSMPAVDAVYGRAWVTWADPRENGLNIYAANYLYLATDVDDNDDDPILPRGFALSQNYPNPFNPSTVIEFTLVKQTRIELAVYNTLGQRVKTLASGRYAAGEHRVVWDGTDMASRRVASGIYLYRLTGEDFSEEKKMVLIK